MSYRAKRIDLALRGGIQVQDMLPHLPPGEDVFFDCRHGVWDYTDGILPFAVTTRIGANNQQWLKIYER